MNENFVFPSECKAIIDVTKPPYNIDNTGNDNTYDMLWCIRGNYGSMGICIY